MGLRAGDDVDFQERCPLPLAWWAALMVLLVAEFIFLSSLFDHSTAPRIGGSGWTYVISLGGWIARPAVASITAALLIGCVQMRGELHRQLDGLKVPSGSSFVIVLVHLAALCGFALLTGRVQAGELQSSRYSTCWNIAWVSLGIAAISLWTSAAIPFRLWSALLRRGGASVLLLAGLVGVLAVLAAEKASKFWEHDWGNALNTSTTRSVYWALSSDLCLAGLRPGGLDRRDPFFRGQGSRPLFRGRGYGPHSRLPGAYLAIFRRACRFPHALLLLPTGVALMWLANIGRIVMLVSIGSCGYPSVADKGFHTPTPTLAGLLSTSLGSAWLWQAAVFAISQGLA